MIPLVKIPDTRKKLGRLFVLICITLYAVGQTVGAQTRFASRDTTPDISKYGLIEECIAGFHRVLRAEEIKLPDWRDTIELVGGEEFKPIPGAAQNFSSRCLAKFNPDSVNLDMYLLWIRLYLGAGNDDAAQLTAKRKLASLSWEKQDSSIFLGQAIDSILNEYSRARPYRADLVRSLLDSYLEGPSSPSSLEQIVNLYFSKVRYELFSGDTVAGKLWAHKILSLIDSFPRSEKDSEFVTKHAPASIASAMEIIEGDALLDSLRVSGQAYAQLRRSFWKDVTTGSAANDYIRMVGEKAMPLVGEFKYAKNGNSSGSAVSTGVSSSGTSYPTAGKVSLIVFLYGGCRVETPIVAGKARDQYNSVCFDSYSVLRRLAEEYPDVEMTIVSRTMGYLGQLNPLSPENEASMLRWWWLENHKLPASLIITNTEYFRLPGLDRRRIDSPDENMLNYSYLASQRRNRVIENKTFYLVDSDGTILESGTLDVRSEQKLKPILDIITKRLK